MSFMDSGYLFNTLGCNPMLFYFVAQIVSALGIWSSLSCLLCSLPGCEAY